MSKRSNLEEEKVKQIFEFRNLEKKRIKITKLYNLNDRTVEFKLQNSQSLQMRTGDNNSLKIVKERPRHL